MSESLFDDESIPFVIIINEQQQHSIWQETLTVPAGWSPIQEPMSRQKCMNWLERNWTDLRPQSLRQKQEYSA